MEWPLKILGSWSLAKHLTFMKIKMHYMYGKQQQVACGRQNVLVTTNYREITCKRCLKTREHRKVKGNATPVPVLA
jgi:hypothetical protein